MGEVIVISDISLDGIVQAPGALDEDRSGGLSTAAGLLHIQWWFERPGAAKF